jgi:hypothetical protein
LVISDILLGLVVPFQLAAFIAPSQPFLVDRQMRQIIGFAGTGFLIYTSIGWFIYSWLTLRGVYHSATARLKAGLVISEQDQNALMLMAITRIVTGNYYDILLVVAMTSLG